MIIFEQWVCSFLANLGCFEIIFGEFINLKGILNEYILIMGWYDRMINLDKEMEGFIQELFGLELDLLIIHFCAEVACTCLVCWNHVDIELATLILLTYDW